MPFCPNCGREYDEGAAVCLNCNQPLLSEEPVYCDNCGEAVEMDDRYCSSCGTLFSGEEEEVECENHTSVSATGVCVVCGKPVCDDCACSRGGKFFCEDDKHVRIYEGWAVLLVTGLDYEAQMVKANLERASIECLVFSQQDHALFLTIGDLAKVKVMVPKSKLIQAQKLLDELGLLDENGEEEGE